MAENQAENASSQQQEENNIKPVSAIPEQANQSGTPSSPKSPEAIQMLVMKTSQQAEVLFLTNYLNELAQGAVVFKASESADVSGVVFNAAPGKQDMSPEELAKAINAIFGELPESAKNVSVEASKDGKNQVQVAVAASAGSLIEGIMASVMASPQQVVAAANPAAQQANPGTPAGVTVDASTTGMSPAPEGQKVAIAPEPVSATAEPPQQAGKWTNMLDQRAKTAEGVKSNAL